MNRPNSILVKIVLGLFLFLAKNEAFAQQVFQGTVANYETGDGIPYATVFITNTTFGVSADENGKFSLSIPEGNYEVIIRMLGYNGLVFSLSTDDLKPQGYRFLLSPSEEELDLVEVKVNRDPAWYRNLESFKAYFLGTSENGIKCKFLNETVLRLDDQSESGVLKVTAADILRIENPNLGYRLDYLLEEFRYQRRDGYVFYAGYPLFVPDSSLSRRRQGKVEKEREKAYRGSLQHLVRSIYEGNTEEEGFVLRKLYRIPDPSNPDKFVNQLDMNPFSALELIKKNSEGKLMLSFSDYVHVTYTEELESVEFRGRASPGKLGNQVSTLHLEMEELEIYANGSYADPFGILVEGYIAWERVGDLLPMDYMPEVSID
ncbi:carboxypeptidase-like regulatory domain-containing protein [Algoriphagus yeomjeoni]|uniref:Carboxypeptidase-like protein n=1 Tax=Algoriphagus yeomjeoni TaxID=291403 RepID=A0A327PR65_9BACT|nr:carboxypeptidase-like regulatory domain-containing protein [Algoriphagus yeomjeoni]RAI94047.1 carboxypeptidase-like protein [Algoriphagus yeomjeoni]